MHKSVNGMIINHLCTAREAPIPGHGGYIEEDVSVNSIAMSIADDLLYCGYHVTHMVCGFWL